MLNYYYDIVNFVSHNILAIIKSFDETHRNKKHVSFGNNI